MKKIIVLYFSILIVSNLSAQTGFYPQTNIPVIQFGLNSALPWAGGLNDASFSEIDLNQDGVNDLFVFEKDNGFYGTKFRITTYINNNIPGTVSYSYAPEYISRFPNLKEFALLRDYNCDGKADIFTYSTTGAAGLAVYKNISDVTNGLQFQLEYSLINSVYGGPPTNLYVAKVNQPGLDDVDNDGDLDVVTFPVIGNYMEYHRNYAQENFGRCDTFVMQFNGGCWGHTYLASYSNSAILGAMCKMPVEEPPYYEPTDAQHGLHSGSCMTLLDYDKDGDKEVLNGDILSPTLLLIINGGDSANANFTAQDSLFPIYDNSCTLIDFHDPSLVDINNDGKKDLLVSPCRSGVENYNSVWYYKNVGITTDSFQYQTSSMFIDKMIDVGEGANVRFFDADNDGLKDIIIGNYGYFQNDTLHPYLSALAYFRNTGTTTAPQFTLITTDYANISQYNLTGIHPCFADMDGDSDMDMIIGDEWGNVHYFTNTAPIGQPATFNLTGAVWFGIDAGKFAAPTVYDINKDGLKDLIIGNELGRLCYYQNTGSATAPQFASGLGQSSFGSVLVARYPSIKGYAVPFFFDNNGNTELLVAAECGNVYYYDHIDNNLTGAFTLLDSVYKNIFEPVRPSMDLYDINGDGKQDMILGNYSGGATIYYQLSNVGIDENTENNFEYSIYPNPASENIIIKSEFNQFENASLIITDATGRILLEKEIASNYTSIETNQWADGLYFCVINNGVNSIAKKFIVRKK